MTRIVTLSTPELGVGMKIRHHGMHLLIDRPNQASEHAMAEDPTLRCFNALVLNREEVDNEDVPYGWTTCEFYPNRGLPAEPKGTHRWPVQGNELAKWYVELHSISEDQARNINSRTYTI